MAIWIDKIIIIITITIPNVLIVCCIELPLLQLLLFICLFGQFLLELLQLLQIACLHVLRLHAFFCFNYYLQNICG